MNHSRFLPLVLNIGLATCAWAGNPVSWTFDAQPATGDSVIIQATATCTEGWHIYALDLPSDQGPLPTELRIVPEAAFKLAGKPTEPESVEKDDPSFGVKVRYHPGTVTFRQVLLRNSPKQFAVKGEVEYMACNDKTCLPPHAVPFTLDVPVAK